jgi:hypothetical protein
MARDGGRGYDAARDGPPSEIIFTAEEAPEGGLVTRALGHSIFTEADDLNARAMPCATRSAAISMMPTGRR